jgi:copper chaperone
MRPFAASYHLQARGNLMSEFTLSIEGMHCGACVRRAGQALAAVEGLTVGEVRVGAARLSAADESTAAPAAIDALAQAGYKAQLDK